MKLKIKYLLLISSFLIYGMIFSQKDYESGYVILNNRDTLFGMVKDRKQPPFGKLYKKVNFKEKRKRKKYGPQEIMGYKQGYAEYESLWINENGYLFFENYSSKENSGEKEFLKIIIKGYLSYYQREFATDDSDYIDHIKLFKREDEDRLVRVTQGIFGLKKRSLSKYFRDCPELVKMIQNGEIKDPVAIVEFYNAWKLNKADSLGN